MAPNTKMTTYDPDAEQVKNVPLLAKFLCRDCNAWKTSEGFSKREQNHFRYKKLSDPGLNGVRAKLRCRKCIGEPVQELLCQGQCGIWKSLDKFSKSQRSGGGAKWCQECILWKEAAEPGLPPVTAPGATEENSNQSAYYSDPENGGESDEETGWNKAPWQGFSALSVNDKEGKRSVNASVSTFGVSPATPTPSSYMAGLAQAVTTSSTSIGTSIQRDYVPPQVRETNNASSNTAAANASSSVRDSVGGVFNTVAINRVPPASILSPVRDPVGGVFNTTTINRVPLANASSSVRDSQSSMSNPYDDRSSSSGWSAVDARRRQAVTYNAYDPSGQLHVQQRVTSGTSHSSPPKGGRQAWAKPVGSRTTPAQQFADGEPSEIPTKRGHANYFDSDEEEDEMWTLAGH